MRAVFLALALAGAASAQQPAPPPDVPPGPARIALYEDGMTRGSSLSLDFVIDIDAIDFYLGHYLPPYPSCFSMLSCIDFLRQYIYSSKISQPARIGSTPAVLEGVV